MEANINIMDPNINIMDPYEERQNEFDLEIQNGMEDFLSFVNLIKKKKDDVDNEHRKLLKEKAEFIKEKNALELKKLN